MVNLNLTTLVHQLAIPCSLQEKPKYFAGVQVAVLIASNSLRPASTKIASSSCRLKPGVKYKNNKEKFIESLPLRFTTQDFHKSAKTLKINSKSAERYITKLCKDNFLVRESQGNYYNPSKEDNEENKESKGL